MDQGTAPSSRELLAQSDAFREASLRSEERRALAVISAVLLVATPVLLIESARPVAGYLKAVALVAALSLLVLQSGVILLVRRARRRRREFPLWAAAVTVVLECSVPTLALMAHLEAGVIEARYVLFSPPVLGYTLLIALTTLRLRPWLCVLGGMVSAGGHAALVIAWLVAPSEPPPTGAPPNASYFVASIFVLVSGIAASWVCAEMRAHVVAALGEAEARARIARMEQDMQIARSIQRALLPAAPPSIQGYDLAGWNRPADQTGGDYFDWQRMPDGNWLVSLADVCGHGVGPALVTAACRAYMRASTAHHRDLGDLASHVNRLLAEDMPEGRFVTMACALLAPERGEVALLSAGHGPIAMYIAATGEVRDIMPRDMPLAIVQDVEYGPAQMLDLQPGDMLALVTDGFVEWSRKADGSAAAPGDVAGGRREQFGVARLHTALARHAALPARKIIEAVAREVDEFSRGEPQQDDLTIVVIRRAG